MPTARSNDEGEFCLVVELVEALTAVMLHASSGLTVLALTVARVAWRLLNVPPPHPAGMKPWERHTAHFAHFLLYAAMVLMPLSGWAIRSAHAPPGSHAAAVEFPVHHAPPSGAQPGVAPIGPASGPPSGPPPVMKIWNLVPMPIRICGLAPRRRLPPVGLLILHVAGALKHQFIDRQSELGRMGIGRSRKS